MSIERDIVRIQALNSAKENNSILLVVHKEDRHDMKAVGEGDYSTLPQEFRGSVPTPKPAKEEQYDG